MRFLFVTLPCYSEEQLLRTLGEFRLQIIQCIRFAETLKGSRVGARVMFIFSSVAPISAAEHSR